MAINPRVAARKEAEIAFLKAEDDRLKDLGKKRQEEAAEKSAAEDYEQTLGEGFKNRCLTVLRLKVVVKQVALLTK